MLDDGKLLLRAILAEPECDAPRLIYADYLQEQGEDERAEFIRVQVELARWEGVPAEEPKKPKGDGSYFTRTFEAWRHYRNQRRLWRAHGEKVASLRKREEELWSKPDPWGRFALPAGWVVGLNRTIGNGSPRQLRLHRGFVESLTCSAADWLPHAEDLLAEHPVKSVALTTDIEVRIHGVIDRGHPTRERHDVSLLAGDLVLDGHRHEVRFAVPPNRLKSRTVTGYLEAIYGVKFQFNPSRAYA